MFVKGDTQLTLSGDAQIIVDGIIYQPKNETSSSANENKAKVFVVEGTFVSNLEQNSNAEVVYLKKTKIKEKKQVAYKKKAKSKVIQKLTLEKKYSYKKESVFSFQDLNSNSKFHHRYSQVFFALVSLNPTVKKSNILFFSVFRGIFSLSIIENSKLQFYSHQKPPSRDLNSFRSRPPPYFALS